MTSAFPIRACRCSWSRILVSESGLQPPRQTSPLTDTSTPNSAETMSAYCVGHSDNQARLSPKTVTSQDSADGSDTRAVVVIEAGAAWLPVLVDESDEPQAAAMRPSPSSVANRQLICGSRSSGRSRAPVLRRST